MSVGDGTRPDRERYARACEIFNEALELDAAGRAALLDSIASDGGLSALVRSMLEADEAEGRVDERPVVEADRLIAGFTLDSAVTSEEVADGDGLDLVPEAVGDYRILRSIGSGGMGVVYLAEQVSPKRRVALKIVRPENTTSELVRRFRLESELLGRLSHDGIARIHEAGRAPLIIEGRTVAVVDFIAMEFVDGVPLDRWRRGDSPELKALIELMARVADAVHAAHESGIVHRDLKPQNILVRADGSPKIIDFGVARLTEFETLAMRTVAGTIVGTLSYMSPEQVGGDSEELDGRSDVYSLGVVLYQLLAGRLPYDVGEKSIAEAARVIRETDPIRPSAIDLRLGGDLENVIRKALEKERERRYASAHELALDLRRHLASEPVSARPPSTFYVMRKFARRHASAVLGGVAAVLALIAGTIVSVMFAIEAGEQAEVAERRRVDAADAAYSASLRAAALALENQNYTELEEALAGAPSERRDWEWRYFRARLGRSKTYFSGGSYAVFDGEGRLHFTTKRDGRRLVMTPGLDRTVELARPRMTGEALTNGPPLVLSADARRAMSILAGRLIAWDAKSGEIVADHVLERDYPTYHVLLGDGHRVALLYEGTGQIVDLDTGEVKSEFATRDARDARVSANGKRIYIADDDLTIVTLTGEHAPRQVPLPRWVTRLAVAPGGREVAMMSLDDRSLEVFDTEKGRVRTLRPPSEHADSRTAMALAYLDDEVLIRSDVDGSLEFLDTTGETRFRIPTPLKRVEGIVVSPDRKLVAAFGSGGCHVVDLEARNRPQVLGGHEAGIYAVAVSADGALTASGGWDHRVVVRSAIDDRELATYPTGTSWHDVWRRTAVQNLAFSADGRSLSGWALRHRRWDLLSGARSETDTSFEDHGARVSDARISHYNDGISLVSSADGRLRTVVVEENGGSVRLVLREEDSTSRRERPLPPTVSAVAIDPGGRRIACGSDQGLEVRDTESLERVAHQARRFDYLVLEYSPDGRRLFSGTRDGVIRIWDAETLDLVARLPGHTSYVYSLRFSPDGTRLYSAGGDGTVRVWDTVGTEVRRSEAAALKAARERMARRIDRAMSAGKPGKDVLDSLEAGNISPIDLIAARDLVIERAPR